MTAVPVTRCVFLFFVFVPILVGQAQNGTNEDIVTEKIHLYVKNYCKGVMGATDDDVKLWQNQLPLTEIASCFGACIAGYLKLLDPPIVLNHTSPQGCVIH